MGHDIAEANLLGKEPILPLCEITSQLAPHDHGGKNIGAPIGESLTGILDVALHNEINITVSIPHIASRLMPSLYKIPTDFCEFGTLRQGKIGTPSLTERTKSEKRRQRGAFYKFS